jgi:Rod binding domain-containing protein
MRNSPFKDATFSGGKAGDAYAGLFDQQLAANAGGGMAGKLVDSLVKKFKSAKGAQAVNAYAK